MLARRPFFLIAVVFGASGMACNRTTGTSEEKSVAQIWEAYRSAVLKADGKTAVDCVSSNTIELYQEYRDLAVSGDKKSIESQSMVNRMQILLMRHRIDPKLLRAMDGAAVFAHAVDKNWIGKNGVIRAGLEDISVSGSRATAKVTADGKSTGEHFHFVKEAESWKYDLGPTIKGADQALQQLARQKGLSDNEYIFSMISSLSGRKVTEAIWSPVE